MSGAYIPIGRAINPISKTNWEGTGVQPDIAVPAEQALDVAYREALKAILTIDRRESPPRCSKSWRTRRGRRWRSCRVEYRSRIVHHEGRKNGDQKAAKSSILRVLRVLRGKVDDPLIAEPAAAAV